MYLIEYSALKYYNSAISEECLYIGMLYNNVTTGQRDFKYISNFKRLQSFDDEADINFIKTYLRGIKSDVENNIFNYSTFNMRNYIRFFVNEFKFSDLKAIEVSKNEDYIETFTQLYLKYDYNKNKRLKKEDEKKLIRRILSSSNLSLSKPQISGTYEEDVYFDFLINDNIGVKYFELKGKDLKRVIPSAKQWSFTAGEFRGDMKVVFLYNYDSSDDINFNIIINILKEHATVLPLNCGLEYILKKSS